MRIKNKQDLIKAFDGILKDQKQQETLIRAADDGILDKSNLQVFRLLNLTQNHSCPKLMRSKCGVAAPLLCRIFNILTPDIGILQVTANTINGSFHQYNVVRLEGESEIQILDASAAQFFSDPLEVFNGKPYFLGTRNELKTIVKQKQENTLSCLQNAFRDKNFKTLKDVDRARSKSKIIASDICEVLEESKTSTLISEYFDQAFEAIWGNKSSFREDAHAHWYGNHRINSDDWCGEVINGYNEQLDLP